MAAHLNDPRHGRRRGLAPFVVATGLTACTVLGVAGLVEAENGDLYLNDVQGIVRVRAPEFQAGLTNPRYPMQSEWVTERDFTGPAAVYGSSTPAARAADGTLWFRIVNGVLHLNPDARSNNQLPILSTGSITADRVLLNARRTFEPQPRSLAIQYPGVNLPAPDRVRYRYKLEGFDDEWQDAGARTDATYTRLKPGTYTFRVMVANEAGAWTPVTSAQFTVLPSFYRTTWFTVLAAAGTVALAWLGYSLRIRSITALLQARAKERADECVRIARELHDTLLGDVAGVAMQLSAAARRVEMSDPTGAAGATAAELLSTLSAQVQRTLVEGRRAVTAMRTAPEELSPLHERLADEARRTFAGSDAAVHVEHAGPPYPLSPTVQAQILAIAAQAMANARQHSDCDGVTVTCSYAPRALRVRVRDNGRGFDPSQETPTGHWGLVGMRERAEPIGARLSVTSAPGAGTEVTLIMPGKEERRRWWRRIVPFTQD